MRRHRLMLSTVTFISRCGFVIVHYGRDKNGAVLGQPAINTEITRRM